MSQLQPFRDTVLAYYGAHGRHDMPWRHNTEPYRILVSELMLQQTQVARVLPKFQQFITAFPTIESLAHVPLADVLGVWLGLGYNRRARFLHMAAKKVSEDFDGALPSDRALLESLPGIGPNTAGAIMAYAFNQPVIFVETNIRTVYIHHFFSHRSDVDDRELKQLLEQTLDLTNPREWYWALMDYGTHLKATAGNNTYRSRHYKKQSKFEGSLRQLRGAILRELHSQPQALAVLQTKLPDGRLGEALKALTTEGFVRQAEGVFRLTGFEELP